MIIPDSVVSIGAAAFWSSGLINITIPNGITSIEYGVFESCYSLKSVTIPNSVISIKSEAFSGCKELENVAIPDSVTSIGKGAFQVCEKLANVTLPESLVTIGAGAFYRCTSLKSITIPQSITSMDSSVFRYCSSLTNVTFSNGSTLVGSYMFGDCTSLTIVTLPDSVTHIRHSAFTRCNSLTDVYYSGSEESWNSTNIGDNNSSLTNATIHYNSRGPSQPVTNTNITETTIPSSQYWIHVTDENGNPLKGATVFWEDSTEVLTADTDEIGNVCFPSLTLGTPKIDVFMSGYTSWSNRNSNWAKSDKHYSLIRLYPEAYGEYKLATAYYSNSSSMANSTDLLGRVDTS